MSATPSVQDIAEALSTAIESVPGLRTLPYLADTISPPVALVDIDDVEYHGAFGGADVVHTFTIFVIVARASDRAGIQLLEAYMSQAGNEQSICGAIEADKSLGGVISTLVVTKSGPVAPVTIPGSDVIYMSVPFTVIVHA